MGRLFFIKNRSAFLQVNTLQKSTLNDKSDLNRRNYNPDYAS